MFKTNAALKITLLLASMMTMMAGAVMAPSLPQIKEHFAEVPNVDLLTRLIITLPGLFIAFLAPVAGWFIDIFGRKKMLIYSLVLYGIAGSSGFFLDNMIAILVSRAFLGIAVAGIMTTAVTLIGDYFRDDERNAFMGIQAGFMGLGGVVFISMAGLFADIQWNAPFLIYAFSFIVTVFAFVYLYEPQVKHSKDESKESKVSRTSFPRIIILIYLIAFFGVVFFYMLPVQIPFLLKNLDNVSNAMVGYAISLATLSSAIISMNFSKLKKRFDYPFIYFITFLMLGIGYFLVSRSQGYWMYLVSLIISGLGVGLIMPTANLWVMVLAPVELRGRLIGNLTTAIFLGQFCSPILLQPIINSFSISNSFLIVGIFLVILSMFFFVFDKRKKTLAYDYHQAR
jgi:MFS family permease